MSPQQLLTSSGLFTMRLYHTPAAKTSLAECLKALRALGTVSAAIRQDQVLRGWDLKKMKLDFVLQLQGSRNFALWGHRTHPAGGAAPEPLPLRGGRCAGLCLRPSRRDRCNTHSQRLSPFPFTPFSPSVIRLTPLASDDLRNATTLISTLRAPIY